LVLSINILFIALSGLLKLLDDGFDLIKLSISKIDIISQPIDRGLAFIDKAYSGFKIPKVKINNIYSSLRVVSIILICSLVIGIFFTFSQGARASLANWKDKSFEAIFYAGESMADFVFKQSRNTFSLIDSAQEAVGNVSKISSEALSHTPQLIEETTQGIEKISNQIVSSTQSTQKELEIQFQDLLKNLFKIQEVLEKILELYF